MAINNWDHTIMLILLGVGNQKDHKLIKLTKIPKRIQQINSYKEERIKLIFRHFTSKAYSGKVEISAGIIIKAIVTTLTFVENK